MKNKIYEHIIPDIREWPIYHMSQNRESFINDLRTHSIENIKQKYEGRLKHIMRRTAYQERMRIKNQPWKADPSSDRVFWKKVQNAVQELPDDPPDHEETLEMLERLVNRYSLEIVGNFKIKTFKFARRFLTAFFGRMLNAAGGNVFTSKKRLQEKLIVNGEVEKVRALFNKGTVVVVPTHFSNLDSILVGYALDAIMGLPAFTYGAGLNLYDSEIIGYFMNRLGAYRVDRRKKNPIYIETLKSMSNVSIQKGINSLFFPGGTRSRNGMLESSLKQGLLHSLIEAQREIYEKGEDQKIIVVPFILNYHFVLEADHLITQHLNRLGQDKFQRVKDDFKSTRKLMKFLWKLFSESSEIYLSVGHPMDVLGNPLDEDGNSRDIKNNKIELSEYFHEDGLLKPNQQREKVYTNQLADSIIQGYKRYNTILSSHVVAFAAFQLLQHSNEEKDIFAIIRQPEEDYVFEREKLLKVMNMIMKRVLEMVENKEVMSSEIISRSTEEILKEGLKQLGVYHANKPLLLHEGLIVSKNFKTLYYYHNRLANYRLEEVIEWGQIS